MAKPGKQGAERRAPATAGPKERPKKKGGKKRERSKSVEPAVRGGDGGGARSSSVKAVNGSKRVLAEPAVPVGASAVASPASTGTPSSSVSGASRVTPSVSSCKGTKKGPVKAGSRGADGKKQGGKTPGKGAPSPPHTVDLAGLLAISIPVTSAAVGTSRRGSISLGEADAATQRWKEDEGWGTATDSVPLAGSQKRRKSGAQTPADAPAYTGSVSAYVKRMGNSGAKACQLFCMVQAELGSEVHDDIQAWFSKAGEVDSVSAPKPVVVASGAGKAVDSGWTFVVATFADETTAKRALSMRAVVPSRDGSQAVGATKWLNEYRAARPKAQDMQQEVDAAIAAYELKEEEEAKRLEALAAGPDEDGFITVTRKSRDKAFESDLQKKKKKRRAMVAVSSAGSLAGSVVGGGGGVQTSNFYRFQMRETKRNKLAELRRKFEEDKARIARMKAGRKFKP